MACGSEIRRTGVWAGSGAQGRADMRVDLVLGAIWKGALWRRGAGSADTAVGRQGPGVRSRSAERVLLPLPLSFGIASFPAIGG